MASTRRWIGDRNTDSPWHQRTAPRARSSDRRDPSSRSDGSSWVSMKRAHLVTAVTTASSGSWHDPVEVVAGRDRIDPALVEPMREELERVADTRLEEETRSPSRQRVLFYLRALGRNWRPVLQAIRSARPWLLPMRLSRVTTAAVVTIVVLTTRDKPARSTGASSPTSTPCSPRPPHLARRRSDASHRLHANRARRSRPSSSRWSRTARPPLHRRATRPLFRRRSHQRSPPEPTGLRWGQPAGGPAPAKHGVVKPSAPQLPTAPSDARSQLYASLETAIN